MKNPSRKAPELRFKGFFDDWEQRKFDDLVDRITKHSNDLTLPTVEFKDIVSGEGRLNNKYSMKGDDRSGIIFRPTNILFGKLRPYLENWLFANFKGKAIGDFWVFRSLENYSLFIYYLIQTNRFQKKANLSTGTRMPRSDWNIISNTVFQIPKDIEEQKIISSFLNNIENTIYLHQRKLDALEQLKEAYLQNIFPQKGELVPKVRFANFTGEWEERKLGSCFSERVERTDKGELLSVTLKSGVVKTESLDRKNNSSADKRNYKKVEVGDIAYNSMRMWQGASGLSNYSGIVSPAYTILNPTKDISSLFFSYQFKLTSMIHIFQSNSQGLTSDTWNLKYPSLKNIKVRVPSYEEQLKIGHFFKQIDIEIKKHSNSLQKLSLLKRGYLQKMFI